MKKLMILGLSFRTVSTSSTVAETFSRTVLRKHFPFAETIDDRTHICIETRQLNRKVGSILGVEMASRRCRHGFPRAFVRFPVDGGNKNFFSKDYPKLYFPTASLRCFAFISTKYHCIICFFNCLQESILG